MNEPYFVCPECGSEFDDPEDAVNCCYQEKEAQWRMCKYGIPSRRTTHDTEDTTQ